MSLDCIIPNWPAPGNIRCVTTTRQGGCSQKEYSSLNLGSHVKDDPSNVEKNRQSLKQDLKLPNDPVWLEQEHGSSVLNLGVELPTNNPADGAYTNESNVVCAVLTADCLPVTFCDQSGEHIAVAHAGWRGLLHGVLENALQAMPIVNENIICWLGPAIGPDKFEVGSEVREKFMQKNSAHENAFQARGKSKYLADIYQLARNILAKHNVKGIYGGNHCTFIESEKFYSYRRDGETGRIATLIWKGPLFNTN